MKSYVTKNPFFSIVTCTLNSEEFIEKNIKSVQTQTLTNYEHIFVDGYSDDDTREILEKYRKKHSNIVKIVLQNPKGISVAMNKGIKMAKGEYIIHLHSDDSFYDQNVLEHVRIFLINNNFPDWIYGKIMVIEKNGKRVGTFPNQNVFHNANDHLLKLINYIPHQSVFIKKKVFYLFGFFDESLVSSMDYDLWLKIATKTRWLFINRVISNFTVHKNSQSSDRNKIQINNKEQIKVVKKHLNITEYLLHLLVKLFLDAYNRTRR